jgi:tetratricopeptide (TPR) repeat protein
MDRIERTVFISYRRTNVPWALAIFKDLTQHGYDVFFDFNGIASGDFEQVILENIRARAHFLVLLTPSALDRCDESTDWLRREIETALSARRNIVPLMLEGFDFNTPKIADKLRGTLSALNRYNAVPIPAEYFDEAMERLRGRYLSVPLNAVLHPPSPIAKHAAAQQQTAAQAAPAVQKQELTAQQFYELAFDAKGVDEQLRLFTEAIRLSPKWAEAYGARSLIRLENDDYDGAIGDSTEAIRLKPGLAEAFLVRGTARRARDDFEGAIKDCTEAIRLKADFDDAFYMRGNARQGAGDIEGSLRDYTDAIRLNPDNFEALSNRSVTRYATGDLNGALDDCTKVIRLDPDNPTPFLIRAAIREARGDLKGAKMDNEKAERLAAATDD